MIKKNYVLLLLLCVMSTSLWSQYRWELGMMTGVSTYQGDFVGSTIPSTKDAGFAFGITATYVKSNVLSFRGGVTVGTINGNDVNYENLKNRGLSFSSSVKEFSAVAIWEPLGARRYLSGANFTSIVSPYVFGGFAIANINPDVDIANMNASLEKRVLKDQNAEYFSTRFTIPVGLGVRVDISEYWVFGIEGRGAPAFNDYLDGISYAGNPDSDDWYYFMGVTLVHRLRNSRF